MSRAFFSSVVAIATLAAAAPAGAQAPPIVDVPIDVDRRLPRVWVLPTDDGSRDVAVRMAEILGLTGLVDATAGKPGQRESGASVTMKAARGARDGDLIVETLTFDPRRTKTTRRIVAVSAASRPLDLARAADGVVLDLTGERSHLSGRILFTDLSRPGHRVVRVALATGEWERGVSPPDAFARGADFGPGGRIHFAMSRPGEPLRLFIEGRSEPLPTLIPGDVQTVAIAPDGESLAIAGGTTVGSSVWVGPLLGPLRVASKQELALGPSFDRDGRLAFVEGPARGPLRVVFGDRVVSPGGVWASSPASCRLGNRVRFVYGADDGLVRITELDGGTSVVVRGDSPVCSPDGRTLVFSIEGSAAGLFSVGADGVSKKRFRVGAATNLRWSTGATLPPEG